MVCDVCLCSVGLRSVSAVSAVVGAVVICVFLQCGAVDRAVVCDVCLCSVGTRVARAFSAVVGAVVMCVYFSVEQWTGQWFVLCAFVQLGSVLSVRFQPRSVQL